jgi:hypothetical protein
MSSELLKKTADVLDLLASELDREEVAREKVAQDERMKLAQELGDKYTTTTGEDLSEDVLAKIASSDAPMVEAFTSLMDRRRPEFAEGSPDDMGDEVGGPDNAAVVGQTKTAQLKEAADEAGDSLVNWCMK